MKGEIETRSLRDFQALLQAHPQVKRVNIVECPGSSDDAVNFRLGRLVYSRRLHTHLVKDGTVASGGVDFFLAGHVRSRGPGARFGVHSWSTGQLSADQLDDEDPSHDLYLEYYESIGLSPSLAEDFYFFTLDAAGPDDIHIMTEGQLRRYRVLTNW